VIVVSRVPVLVLIAACFIAEGCIWKGDRSPDDLDAGDPTDLAGAGDGFATGTGGGVAGGTGTGGDSGIAGATGTGGSNSGAGGTGVGGGTGIGGSAGSGAGSGGAATGGQGASIDASQPDTGAADLTQPNDTGPPPATCGPAGAPIKIWAFGGDVESWDFADGTMIWTGAVGDPDPGALQVDWTGALPVHPRRVQALGDLRGRVVTARVWVDSSVSVGIKVFVQTGSRYWWADGGVVMPPRGQWTCVTLDISNPAFSRQQYDPTDVQVLGVELQTTGSGRVYIDQVTY